jgi:hypothetical protein
MVLRNLRHGSKDSQGTENSYRPRLASLLVGFSVAGLTIMSVTVIALAPSADRYDASQLVFGAVLPVLGTWVGTVLAFYFARENFESATESALRATGWPSRDTLVGLVMIPITRAVARYLGPDETDQQVTLGELLHLMRTSGFKRISVLDEQARAMCVVTGSGAPTEPVPSWLTNTMLATVE